jgi:hypothetical protein
MPSHLALLRAGTGCIDSRSAEIHRHRYVVGVIARILKRAGKLAAVALFAQSVGSLEAQINPIHATVSFPQGTPLTTPATIQPYLISVAVGDIDGDGLPDVAAASQFPSKIAWYRNNGDGTFGEQLVISTALLGPSCIFAADIDGDGKVDVAASSQIDDRVVWFRNIGGPLSSGQFGFNLVDPSANVRVVSTAVAFPLSVFVADLNADGLPDILSTSAYDNKVAWYRNLGGGDFGLNPGAPSANQIVISTSGASPSSVRAADLDGDSIRDLVVTSGNDNTIAWFKGSFPAGGLPQFTRYVIATNQLRAATSAIADFDGDGWPDLACGSPYGNSTTWFRNRSHDPGATAPFFGPGQVITENTHGVFSVAAPDINADGRPDAGAASLLDNKVSWYENLGGGNFGWNAALPAANEKLITTNALGAISVAAADFNQDGTMDIVAASQDDGKIVLYPNRGGQCALASTDTAPASIVEGHQDDVLRLAVSNRGNAGDDAAQIQSLGFLLEKSAGVFLSISEANALIENLHLHMDSNGSGSYEAGADKLVASISDLQLTNGRLLFPVTGGAASDLQIAPGTTRTYFLVAEIAPAAASQDPSTFRITHLREGDGHGIIKDAASGSTLTVEWSPNPEPASSWVTAQAAPIWTYYQTWSAGFNMTGNNAAPNKDFDFDGLINVLEMALGTNPASPGEATIIVNPPNIIQRGKPRVLPDANGVDFRALYARRKDYLAAGLTYTVQFSGDLLSWADSTPMPTVIAEDAEFEGVTVPFPLFVNGLKARFFRVRVTGQQ